MHVDTYTEPGFASVNSYLIETGAGLLVLDCQRSLSSARRLLERVRTTDRPVLAIFISHPHPDHFGGLPVLTAAFPEAPTYALAATREAMRTDAGGYVQKSKEVLGEDFNADLPVPSHVIQPGESLAFGNVRLMAEDAGPGEAACMLTLHAPASDTLFCADVVQHRMTAFLLEGRLEAWLGQLDAVEARHGAVGTVYPGHGPCGPARELFPWQREYLQTLRGLVAGQVRGAGGSLDEEGKRQVVTAMENRYPGLQPVAAIPNLLALNVDTLARVIPPGS